jgi:hypothetical protein
MQKMKEAQSINAINGPIAPVFPPVQAASAGRFGRKSPGSFLGIVMLDTRFPRPLGDIGNPQSFTVPVRKALVLGAFPDSVVQTAAGLRANNLAAGFVATVRQLERDGAAAITTSCGFLVLLQRELQTAVKVPVVTSSLLMLPGLLRAQKQVGVLTISAASLQAVHLRAAGVPRDRLGDVVVQGVDPKGEFASAILGNRAQMDLQQAEAEVVQAALALKHKAPALTSVVLECTNMPPYAAQIELATGLKTWSLLQSQTLLRPFQDMPSTLARRNP